MPVVRKMSEIIESITMIKDVMLAGFKVYADEVAVLKSEIATLRSIISPKPISLFDALFPIHDDDFDALFPLIICPADVDAHRSSEAVVRIPNGKRSKKRGKPIPSHTGRDDPRFSCDDALESPSGTIPMRSVCHERPFTCPSSDNAIKRPTIPCGPPGLQRGDALHCATDLPPGLEICARDRTRQPGDLGSSGRLGTVNCATDDSGFAQFSALRPDIDAKACAAYHKHGKQTDVVPFGYGAWLFAQEGSDFED